MIALKAFGALAVLSVIGLFLLGLVVLWTILDDGSDDEGWMT